MAALSEDLHLAHKGNLDGYKLTVKAITADTFYAGALVYADGTTGKAQVSIPVNTDVFIGICAKQVTTTAENDPVEIYTGGLWELPYTTPTEADIGDVLFANLNSTPTDNPADAENLEDNVAQAGDIMIGKILAISIEDTTRAWVQLDPGWIYSATLTWV